MKPNPRSALRRHIGHAVLCLALTVETTALVSEFTDPDNGDVPFYA